MGFGVGGTYVSSRNQIGAGVAPTMIDEKILAGATNQIQFTSVPAGYRVFLIEFGIVPTAAMYIQFTINADSGNNYAWNEIRGTGGTITGASSPVNAFFTCNENATTSVIAGHLTIYNTLSAAVGKSIWGCVGSDAVAGISMGRYGQNAEITSIEITASASTFAIGSRAILYGIK